MRKRNTIRIIASLSVLSFLVMSIPVTQAADPWWNTTWTYRKKITIDHDTVSSTLVNFPVLINLASDSSLASRAQSDGDDIVFTDKSGTKLDHEIELFTSSTGRLVAWVKVPSLSSSTDTILYMYYGNSKCTNQQDRQGTWDSNYLMVQHMQEYGTIYDSTSNGFTGVNTGVSKSVNGKIDGCQYFNSLSDSFDMGTSSSLNPGTNSWTITLWTKVRHVEPFFDILNKWDGSKGFTLCLYNGWGGTNYFKVSDGTKTAYRYWDAIWSDGSWHHIAAVINRNTNELDLYVDGVLSNGKGPYSIAGFGSITSSASFLLFGGTYGWQDELTISKTARSTAWIKTSYLNQNNPSSFYLLGSQEQADTQTQTPPPTGDATVTKMVIAYGNTIYYETNRKFIASHFDIVACGFSTTGSEIKALNKNIQLLGYEHGLGMYTSDSDWSYVNQQESWFAHSTSGARIKNSDYGWYLMNPNSGWSDYFAQRSKSLLQQYPYYDGIFVDDIPADLQEASYRFNVAYSNFASGFLTNWESGLLRQMTKTKAAVGSKTIMTNSWKYMQFCEKATHATFWEGFIHSRSQAYNQIGYGVSYDYGLLAINLLNKQAKLGNIIAVNSGCRNADLYPSAARQWQKFTLGCFLMAVENMDKAYYSWQFINTDSSKGYFAEMDYNLGSPVSGYKLLKSRTYLREFQNYYVVVNLDPSYSCSSYINGASYTIQPRNALFIKK